MSQNLFLQSKVALDIYYEIFDIFVLIKIFEMFFSYLGSEDIKSSHPPFPLNSEPDCKTHSEVR